MESSTYHCPRITPLKLNFDRLITRFDRLIIFLTKLLTNHMRDFRLIFLKIALLSCFVFIFFANLQSQNISNYAFTSSTSGSLEDLSSGSTSLLTGNHDDVSTSVAPIGFSFIFMGIPYTHFSANSNGQLQLHTSSSASAIGTNVSTSAGLAILAPFTGDNEVGNGIRYKVIGTAPNRTLVLEWNQFYINFVNINNAGNMQVWLNETTGVVNYVYGEIYNSASTSQTRSISIASSNTATTVGSITIAASPTFTASATLTSNTIAAGSGTTTGSPLIANIGSSSDGSRRVFTFTPPAAVPAAPTWVTPSSITGTGMTLNWTDNATDEVGYVIMRSTDNINFIQQGTILAANTQTLAVTGLTPGILYYWRIIAVREGTGAEATGSETTTSAATYYWVGSSGGDWNTAANWNTLADNTGSTRSTPATTDILIVDGMGTTAGQAGTISISASASIGALQITNSTAVTLQSSTTTTRTITITGAAGDELSVPSGSSLILNNATQAAAIAFSTGTGMTGNIAGTLTFGGSTSNTLTTTGGTGTLVTVTGTGIVNLGAAGNSLVGSVATLSFLDGSNCNSSGATTGAPPVPLATWATTSNLTITGITTSTTAPTNNAQSFGNLTYNCPAATGTMSFWTTSTTAVVKGNLTITAGATGGTGIFRALTSGTVTVNGNVVVNQGRLQSASSTGTFIVLGNTTNDANGIIDILAGTYSQRGATLTNDGVITGPSGTLQFLNFTGSFAQTLAGSGTILTNIASLSVQNTAGLTISHSNQIISARVNLFQGTITNSNKITLGTGLAVACVTQIGASGLTTSGGHYDAAPTFNLGTGTYSIIYAQESVARTTGYEIPSTRAATNVTISNTNGVTLSGGDLTLGTTSVLGLLTLTSGIFNANGNSVILSNTGTTISGGSATSYVDGKLIRSFAASRTASGTYTTATFFPIGKGSYMPIYIDPSTTSGGGVTFSAESFTTNTGTGIGGVTNLSSNRWEALPTSGTGNLTNAFIRISDGTVTSTKKIVQGDAAAGNYGSIIPLTTGAAGPPVTLTTATAILSAAYTGYFAYGDLQDCSVPADQPTAFTVSTLGTTSFTGSFTAASSNPSHYLVVRYPTGGSVTNPSNFTTYTAGNTLGAGTVQAVLTSPTVSFNASGLTANTTYDYYVYSYNNVACNGPVYNTTSPLMGMVTTCATTTGTPGSPTASTVTSTSFTASWTASSTPGVNYIVEVATDAGFTNLVSGYNPLNVGMLLTTPVTGLSPNTTYFVRVRAEIGGCFSVNSGTLTVLTNCNAVAPPRMEGFEDNSNNLDCWRTGLVSGSVNWTIRTGTSGDITGAFSGSTFMEKDYNTSNALIYSLPMNYSSVTDPTRLNVYLHRHASAHVNDEYRIHVNTSATLAGATQILSLFSRTTTAPTVPSTGWYNYLIDIPVSFHGEPVVYIIFQGITTAGFSSYDLGVDDFKVEFLPLETIDWGNLQWPPSGSIYPGQSFTDIYGQAYKAGATEAPGQAPGLNAWIGYNNADTDPTTWSNWIPASFENQVGNNDEFKGAFPANTFSPGTYYYAYRYQYNGGPYRYGGYSIGGGGFWDGTTYVSGELTVNPCPSFTPTATPLSVCAAESSDLSITSSHGGYSYAWNPGSLSGAGPHNVMPLTTTTYTVTATDNLIACSNTATVTVTVNPVPTAVIITPTSSSICSAGPAQLLTANGGTITGTGLKIGSGTGFVSQTSEPTAFCNRWSEYYAQQIYTASEIVSAGISPGSQITSVTFNTNTLGDAANNTNYRVKMGHIGTTSFFPSTSFLSDATYTTVYGPVTHTHTASGAQTITFSTPFVWNGTDNICVQLSHSGADITNNASTEFTTMPDNKTLFYRTSTIGGTSTTGTLSTVRLNVIFTFNQTTNITWTPTTGLYTNVEATNAYTGGATNIVYALPASNTTYTATATSGEGCFSSNTADVTVNPSPTASISGNNSPICSGNDATFNLSGTSGAIVTYNINGGASQMVTLTGGTATVTITGATADQTLNLVSVDNGTCTSALSLSSTVSIATTAAVTSSSDSGAGSLRAAIACIAENGTITYDQPTITTTILTTPLTIDKNVTIQGLSDVARPEITIDPIININATRTLTLHNVDIKSTSPAQSFGGAGDVSITGTTVSKE